MSMYKLNCVTVQIKNLLMYFSSITTALEV